MSNIHSGTLLSKSKRKNLNIPPRNPAWNVWHSLFILVLISLLEMPLGWLATPKNLDTMPGFFHFLTVGYGEGLIYLAAILILFKILRRPLVEMGFKRTQWYFLLLGVLAGVFLFVGVGLLGTLLTKLFGTPPPQSFALAVEGAKYQWQFILILILGGITAPLKEEAFFRGLIYPPLRKAYGKGRGILFTGLFFSALHFDLLRFLPLLIGGIILAWLYERSSSLWPSILAHGTWNILMALALWVQR